MNNEELESEIQYLKQKIFELENTLNQNRKLPSTNLLSENFLTRSFAVLGHYLVAGLIIAVPFYILIFIIILAIGFHY